MLAKLALLTLAGAGLFSSAGCGGGGDETFDGDGYSFTYPGDWNEIVGVESAASGPEGLGPSNFFGPGSTAENSLHVAVTEDIPRVTDANLDDAKAQVAQQLAQTAEQAGAEMSEPTDTTFAGLPGFRAEASGRISVTTGERFRSELIVAFDETAIYFLNCQFTPEGAEEMKRGCDQVVESFQVE